MKKQLIDVTEFKLTNRNKAYLSAILDLCDNSIISYVLGRSNNKLIFDTLDKAINDYRVSQGLEPWDYKEHDDIHAEVHGE